MMPVCLEIACFTPDALLIATGAGAHRLEFCASYAEGGVTPVSGTLSPLRGLIPCPVRVMIRCRGGGFVYTPGELIEMRQQLRRWADEGVDGWVGGCLTPDGMPDCAAMLSIAQAAPSLPFTFHRAFDQCTDSMAALDLLMALGCSHLLSSGIQTRGAAEGIVQLLKYIKHIGRDAIPSGAIIFASSQSEQQLEPPDAVCAASTEARQKLGHPYSSTVATPQIGPRLKLMVGGGIRRENLDGLFGQLGDAVDYHSAAVVGGSTHSTSPDPQPDPEEIRLMLNLLK